ncbi:HNH endonuclease signature motif containing protein [Streptomyces reniochalinae]|uniref:HNH endonuclease n=1 Tax=Streptomyces reniochalinae TaxID=2250578 RepID=A0A367E8V0_9ACTN|nr:HNH endonuclease signature motif containing protein [Streptomyces reniochalinae]RCG14172.1 HNH endonuclease [Streptomyces reniochalinae]
MTSAAKDLIKRVGKLSPAQRANGQALHRPLLLLWSIGQAVHREPREQRWSQVCDVLKPLLTKYANAPGDARSAAYPFWALRKDGLWEVEGSEQLLLTSGGRRPTLTELHERNPLAGLPAEDYDLLSQDRAVAAWVAGTLLVKFFSPVPAQLLDDLGLAELLAGQADASLRPRVGERFTDRNAISAAHGGNNVQGITPLADGILTVYSDDKGPYADGRIPGTDWIAYTGDGLSGDQRLVQGNKSMAAYQRERRALRYWHKPYRGTWFFETWAVIVQCRRRWGVGEDGKQRREYVWVLAPVSSPMPETWPEDVRDALSEDNHQVHDDSRDIVPQAAPVENEVSNQERYKRLTAAAHRTAKGRASHSKAFQTERYLRSPAAREAVILRSEGRCENDTCLGHSSELTDAGAPILDVDHVNGLARTREDTPETMIALCPNCHALKTRGIKRKAMEKRLRSIARTRHKQFSDDSGT